MAKSLTNFMRRWRQDLEKGGWSFGPAAFRRDDPDFVEKARKAQNLLDRADFDEQYGVLQYANAEAMKFGQEAVPAAQNAIASVIAKAYDRVYRSGSQRLGYEIGKEEYFSAYPEQSQAALNMKLPEDPAFLRQEVYPGWKVDDYYPQLKQARTVGDLQSWLVSTVDPGLQSRAKTLSKLGQNYTDVLQSMRLGVLESIPSYQQFRSHEDERVTQQFMVHAGWGAFNAAKQFMSFEKEAGQARGMGLVDEDPQTPFQLLSGAGNYVPEYQDRDEFAILDMQAKAEYNDRWGAYGEPQSRFSSYQLGPTEGTWAGKVGLKEGDVIPGWNYLAREQPQVFQQAVSAMQAGKRVPIMVALRTGASADQYGRYQERYQRAWAFFGGEGVQLFQDEEAKVPWSEQEIERMRTGTGLGNSAGYELPTGLWTMPEYYGRTTYQEGNQVRVAPLSNQRSKEFRVPAVITDADMQNMGAMVEQGLSKTGAFEQLRKAVAGAKRYISGAVPTADLRGFGAIEHFNDWITSLERRHSGNIAGSAYELVDPESEMEREASRLAQTEPDPASTRDTLWNLDPELADTNGFIEISDEGEDPVLGPAAGAEELNAPGDPTHRSPQQGYRIQRRNDFWKGTGSWLCGGGPTSTATTSTASTRCPVRP